MSTLSGSSLRLAPREVWPDADFPEEEPIHADVDSDKGEPDGDDDDDWDMDLVASGGTTLKLPTLALPVRANTAPTTTQMFTIRPPLPTANFDLDDDDEGISTIKAFGTLKQMEVVKPPPPIEEDIEDDLLLPDDMTQLSLRPPSLHHQSSRGSFEWGERDHTSSSQSSDAFTSLGFTGSSASSNSTSASLPETETEDDSDDLEGLVIPTGLFESGHGSKHLAKLLERKKKLPAIEERPFVASPDPEDDFEVGLVIDDDADFSASRLTRSINGTVPKRLKYERSRSAPATRPGSSILRPPSRARKTKSPTNPPTSSMRQLRQLSVMIGPSGEPVRPPPLRSGTLQAPSPSTSGFLAPKSASLRGQKSQSNIKPPSPPGRPLTRKTSLSSLEVSPPRMPPNFQLTGPSPPHPVQRYEAPTAASRAKSQTHSTGRLHTPDFTLAGPSRSPSINISQRLTMPASISRQKSRPTITGMFSGSGTTRATSPLPSSRPQSTTSAASSSKSGTPPLVGSSSNAAAPRLLRKPKKPRPYADGTELDAIDDLPTDRDKESQFRVVAKGYGNRTTAGPSIQPPRSPPRTRTATRRPSELDAPHPTLRRTGRMEMSRKPSMADLAVRKKTIGSPKHKEQKRKPTLIRNLGGVGGPKVVGDMKWNPQTLRWEGNDQALREFDLAATSVRPALITHLTGSSIGSPVATLGNGGKQVGHMVFDPSKMCWLSTLHPDEDEPDVFADLADDEHDDDWEARGGTLRAGDVGGPRSAVASDVSADSRFTSPSPHHSRAGSESGDEGLPFERGSRASLCVADVDESFREECRKAEARHRAEMLGWAVPPPRDTRSREPARDCGFLYEIRALATRQY